MVDSLAECSAQDNKIPKEFTFSLADVIQYAIILILIGFLVGVLIKIGMLNSYIVTNCNNFLIEKCVNYATLNPFNISLTGF